MSDSVTSNLSSETSDLRLSAEPENLDQARRELVRLRELVHAFSQLNGSLELEVVLRDTLRTATQLMKADVGSIALINDRRTALEFVESTDKNFARLKSLVVPLGEGIAGSVAQTGRSVRVEDVRKDERFYGKIDEKLGQRTNSYLCVPLIVEDEIIGTAQIMNRLDGKSFEKEDEQLLEGFARQAALAIHNAKMHKVMMEQQAIESELEVCSQIQAKLFPEKPPAIAGFEIFGSSVPCRQVGGDYFTYVKRADGSYDVVLADVSGKGLAAALMVSELHTGVYMLAQMDYSLERTVQHLNDHLVDSLIVGKFITMFAARLYPGSNEVDYVLAGHPSPFIVNKKGRETRLDRTGLVLGLDKKPPYEQGRFRMDSGDVLIAFSDGYSEAVNDKNELYDEDRIGLLTREFVEMPLSEIRLGLDQAVSAFTNFAPPPDDMTLLMFRKV